MSNLTPELNLVQGEDEDDTADYLTIGLAESLAIIDGMFSAGAGHAHNGAHQGGTLGPNAFADNTIPGAKLVDGSVTAAKMAPGAIPTLESLFAGTVANPSTHYTVAAGIMFVFCTQPIQVTLPAAASTNRPVTVIALNGQSNINAAGGSVFGGSINTSTGAVMPGVCSQGDSLTFKSDLTNWRVV